MKVPEPRRWIGATVFVAALSVRILGLHWGLPNSLHHQSYHPDEPIVWAASQQIDPASLDFTPGFYNYGTLYLTLARTVSAGCEVPDVPTPAAIAAFERCCEASGRFLSALAGAASAWVCYEILRRRTGILGSMLGTTAVALAPAFLVHSRFQTVDALATLLTLGSVACALRLLPDSLGPPQHYFRWAVLSGAFAGLAAGTKYNSAAVIVATLVAVGLSRRPNWLGMVFAAITAMAVAFILATPGFLLENDKFMEGLRYEMGHAGSGHGLVFVGTAHGTAFHLFNLFVGFGGLATALGVAGVAHAAYRRHAWAIATVAFFLVYFVLIASAEVKFLRYTFPLYMPLALGIGWLVDRARFRPTLGRFVVVTAILALGGQLRWGAVYTAWMMGEDPRDEAGRYLKALAADRPGMEVGVISDPWFYTPALYPDVTMTRPQYQREGVLKMAAARSPRVVMFTHNESPDYVAFSSLEARDLDRLASATGLAGPDQARVDAWKSIAARLTREYVPEKKYGAEPRQYVHDLEYIHPEVQIWKRRDLP